MNVLVASSVCWTIATSWRTSAPALRRILVDQALDDLGLEHDVGQALGGSVVHRPGDLAAEVLLGVEQETRHGRGTTPPLGSPPTAAGAFVAGTAPKAGELIDVQGERLAIAAEGPALALEDLDLRLHQGGALGQQDELRVEIGGDGRIALAPDGSAASASVTLSAPAARRVS